MTISKLERKNFLKKEKPIDRKIRIGLEKIRDSKKREEEKATELMKMSTSRTLWN